MFYEFLGSNKHCDTTPRPGYMVHRYTGTWIQGYMDTWIQGYKDTRIQGYKDTRIQEEKKALIFVKVHV